MRKNIIYLLLRKLIIKIVVSIKSASDNLCIIIIIIIIIDSDILFHDDVCLHSHSPLDIWDLGFLGMKLYLLLKCVIM